MLDRTAVTTELGFRVLKNFHGVATPAYAIKFTSSSHWVFYSSLVLYDIKGTCNRIFPFMEADYPFAIKNQRGASEILLVGFECDELVLYGIRLLAPH